IVGLALVVLAQRARAREAWIAVGLFGAAAILVGSPWYIKSYVWTNNPVYPFFYKFFPRSVNWTPEFERAYQNEQRSFGRGHGLIDMLRAPWDVAFHGRHYFITTQRRLQWDRWAGLGPMAIGLGPLALYTRRLDGRAVAFIVYGLLSGVAWWFLSQ